MFLSSVISETITVKKRKDVFALIKVNQCTCWIWYKQWISGDTEHAVNECSLGDRCICWVLYLFPGNFWFPSRIWIFPRKEAKKIFLFHPHRRFIWRWSDDQQPNTAINTYLYRPCLVIKECRVCGNQLCLQCDDVSNGSCF